MESVPVSQLAVISLPAGQCFRVRPGAVPGVKHRQGDWVAGGTVTLSKHLLQ